MHLPREDDDRPPYIQAAAMLREEISTGRLKPGDKLPPARTLQERYGIASSTAQNALRLLKSEGLIYSVQGRGSYVRQAARPATDEAGTPLPTTDERQAHPGASPEYTDLARQVQALSNRVEHLTQLVERVIRDSGR